jgi:hypothetical protein
MSARDELHEAICGDGCGVPKRCERTDRLVDAFAHELAERIRSERGTTSLPDGHFFFSGMDFAADLIDPQAQQPPVDEYRLSSRPGVVGGGA